jgi:tRNA (guanine9-N1)-methyltransferase
MDFIDMTEPTIEAEPPTSPPPADPPLSKNAQKRQLKRQRWEDSKLERRAFKKAKLKQKKETMKLAGERLPPKRRPLPSTQDHSGIRVVVDCGFDELMTEKVTSITVIDDRNSRV